MGRSKYLKLVMYLLLATVLMALALGSCAQPPPPPSPAPQPSPAPTAKPTAPSASRAGWPKAVTVLSSTSTGTFYVIGAAVADMITKHVGWPASVEAAGSSPAVNTLLEKGQAELGVTQGTDLIDAFYGIRVQQGKPIKIRAIMNGHGAVYHLMTLASSGIKTVNDLNGRGWQFKREGSAAYEFGKTLIAATNLKPKELPWASTEATVKAVADGTADVGQSSAIGAGVIRELFLQHDARLLPIPDDVRNRMVEMYPGYVKTVIPKGYYQTRGGGTYPPEDLPGIGYETWIAARADLPEDLVYEITKVILDKPDEFKNYHAEAKNYNLKHATDNPLAPFHPGAIKYYKEKGVWTDALQKTQDSLLAKEPKPK